MNKLWLIARSNLKKRKGNAVTLFLLIAIAIVLMYSSLNVLMNVFGFLNEKNEKQNGAHVLFLSTPNYEDKVLDIVKNLEHYSSVESERCVQTTTICDITNSSNSAVSKDTMMLTFQNMDYSRKISDWDIVDKAETKQDNSIILPMYLKVAKGYKTGDEINIKMAHITKTFVVYGFIEDVMFATPSNITIYSCQTTDKMIDEMLEDKAVKDGLKYNIRVDSANNGTDFENALSKKLVAEMTEPDFSMLYLVNFPIMLAGTTMMINIIMVILAMFSVIMVLIVILIIRFNMIMYLEENLPNIGIMEAEGYTIKQLRNAMLLEYLLICTAGITMGLIIAGTVSSLFGMLVSGSIGLTWTPGADVIIAVGTSAFVIVFVCLIVIRTAARLRNTTTLDALRGGIQTHNFKRNHLPLSESRIDVNTTLGIKSFLKNTKQNIAIGFIVCLLSFACVMSLLIYYNFAGDNKALLTLVGIEQCDIEMASTEKGEDELKELKKKLEGREDIDLCIMYGAQSVILFNNIEEMSVTADISSDFNSRRIHTIYKGREPERDNEIAVTSVIANRFGIDVGGSIMVKAGDVSKSYIVCGISQQISNMGVSCRMTKGAAKRLNSEFDYNGLNLYVNKESKTIDVIDSIKEEYKSDSDLKLSNIQESFDTIMGTFTSSLVVMCAIFVFITSLVVIMIIMLIMKMKVTCERRSIGIYKALGYTTFQIIWQMVVAFTPVVVIGGVVGAIGAAFSLNELFVLALSFSQIMNASLTISIGIVVGCIVFITVLAFAVSALVSSKARKIEPYKMIVEE